MADLHRFVDAQAASYPAALAELRAGAKTGHWMWWIFPQLAGLGSSATARHFALADAEEARAYLAHPLLGSRLRETLAAVMAASGPAERLLGSIDALKLRSCLTLFEAVAGDPAPFRAGLVRLFAGERDPLTPARLR